MTEDPAVAEALDVLTTVRHPYVDVVNIVPKAPGLYAFYGDEEAWSGLGLKPYFDGQPLYVGKAEKSLSGRDVGTHFTARRTGSSTVRRSLAALLAIELDLVPVPRNVAKPDGSANFGLDPASEIRLSDWMEERLTLATWTKTPGTQLAIVESAIVRRLRPPLNLDKVGEPRERLRTARRRMADIARAWQPNAEQDSTDSRPPTD